jgi:hypothetical protein
MDQIGTAGWVAVTVVIILVLIWITHASFKNGSIPDGVFRDTYESMMVAANKQYDTYFETPATLWSRTVGYTNDDTAKLALSKSIKAETAHDTNESLNNGLNQSANDAAVNAFIIAELYRFNVAPTASPNDRAAAMAKAQTYYAKSLRRMQRNANAVVTNNTNTNHPTPETMLTRITDFDIQNQLFADIEVTRHNLRTARVVDAVKPKWSRAINRAKYYKARDIRNDPQNVHDSAVVAGLKNKLNAIQRANVGSKSYDKREIENAIQKSNLPERKRQNALAVLNKMWSTPDQVSTLNDSEKSVIESVWHRINSAENANSSDSLKNAFYDALASSMETSGGNTSMVCTVGRVSRVLESLTQLDASTAIAKPVVTTEMLRNEIFSKAGVIVQSSVASAPKEVADLYQSADDLPSDKQTLLNTFTNNVKQTIANTIKQEYPDINPTTLDPIIKDAQAGVDV